MEDELSLFEDKLLLEKIQEKERDLEILDKQREDDELKRIEDIKNKEAKDKKALIDNNHTKAKRLKRENEIEINKFVKKMKISSYKEIESTYQDLLDAQEGILKIIEEYKLEINKVEKEIEKQKDIYNEANLAAEEEDKLEDKIIQRSKVENDKIDLLEKEYSECVKRNLVKEEEYKRLSAVVNDSCNTVSRIMYQLEKKVTKLK